MADRRAGAGRICAAREFRGREAPSRGTRAGSNDWARSTYGGLCPPIGRHRYFFTLYALDTVLGELDAPTRAALLGAMQGHVLATAELIGTYQRR